MCAGIEDESAGGCVHARAAGEHAGVFDGYDGMVRGDLADADRCAEGRGEAAREGDHIAGGGEEEGGVSGGTSEKDNAEARRTQRFAEKKRISPQRAQRAQRRATERRGEDSQNCLFHLEHDFAGIGVYGREGTARARVAVFRCGVRILYADGAVAPADSGAARASGGAAAGSAGRGAAGFAEGGLAARAAFFALGREPVWRGGWGGGRGSGGWGGAGGGLAGEDSGDDGAVAAGILLVRGAEELRCDALRD